MIVASSHTNILLASAALLLGATAVPALAQDAPPPPTSAEGKEDLAARLNGDSVTIGIGGAYLPDYEGSNDYRLAPGPVAIGTIKGFAFSVVGNRASVDLIPNRPGQSIDLQFGPVGVINFNRSALSTIEDTRIRALGKRSAAIEVGGYVGIGKTGIITSPYDKLSVSLSYRQGVSGAHRSYTWQPTVTYITPLSRKAAAGLIGSAQYSGQGYADSYFSISPAQSLASGLPTFNARKGWRNYSVGGFLTYSLTGDLLHGFKVVAGGTYTRALNDFSYSPIVRIAGSKNQWLGAVGVAYTF
ncbi:MipA/OmpV family protein [Sphingomonas sp. HMP6]|uniref:MipA/OmpV family protein n=1 Tax=Sphingomonas sp. HMP6 TaxID=1517551 RepID=UPI001599949D|nr:MipA/OmpV family protein [Sphingomonas sp. HMP6]BCA59810.1 structural protein MipA [Sphingomonas sp. HMP6]